MASRGIGKVNVERKLLLYSKIKKVDPFSLVLRNSYIRDLYSSDLNCNEGKETWSLKTVF